MFKDIIIKFLDVINSFFMIVIILIGMLAGGNLGGFGGFVLGTILGVMFAAIFGGIFMIMIKNNELLTQIRNNTKKK